MSDLSQFEELVCSLALPRVRAWEILHDPEHSGPLSFTQFYDMAIAAGYSEEEAQKGANERGLARLNAGISM